MKKLSILLLAALVGGNLVLSACSKDSENDIPLPPGGEKSVSAPTGPTGRIRGVVHLKGDVPGPAFEPISENQNICGDRVSVSRLSVNKDKGVQHAFVFLEGVQSSDTFRPRESLLVDQKNCQYAPHTLIVPAGGKIEITNSDPILHNVHAHQFTEEGQRTLFNIAQPRQGQRTAVETSFTPGIVYLTCEAGHPWMSGYVFVANHPYVTLTREDGSYVIEGVPPGTYRIKMWHEGVILKQNIKSLQRYDYEPPYEVTQEVTVPANGEAVVDFDLALRSGT
jgi:plastocyanin